jgi:hypothetical protein
MAILDHFWPKEKFFLAKPKEAKFGQALGYKFDPK